MDTKGSHNARQPRRLQEAARISGMVKRLKQARFDSVQEAIAGKTYRVPANEIARKLIELNERLVV